MIECLKKKKNHPKVIRQLCSSHFWNCFVQRAAKMSTVMTSFPPSENSHVLWRLSLSVQLSFSRCRRRHGRNRRQREWEPWLGRALACCQLFWWLQIGSALVGWSRHQQAEELSKKLPPLSLDHAWCTTRWQNTATAYGGGGWPLRLEETGGGVSDEKARSYLPYLKTL